MKFAVCFHHTEEDIKVWERFVNYLSLKLRKDINLLTFKSHSEERNCLLSAEIDLLFENPEISIDLYNSGYIPIGRLDNQWDLLCLVAREDFKFSDKICRVGIVPMRFALSSLLELEKLGAEINNIKLINMKNLSEVHSALLNSEVDIGITRLDSFNRIPEHIRVGLRKIKEFGIGTFHTFLIHPKHKDIIDMVKDVLYGMDRDDEGISILNDLYSSKVVPVGFEWAFLEKTIDIGILMLDYRNYKSIYESLNNVEHVGVVIENDGIVYANRCALDILGYDNVELSKMSFYDLNKVKDYLVHINPRFEEKIIIRKDGREVYLSIHNSPIIFNGIQSRLIIFIDITRKVILDKMFATLRSLDNIITTVENEQELFSNICRTLVEEDFAKLAWIGKADEKNENLVLLCSFGDDDGYIDETSNICQRRFETSHCISTVAFRENRVIIQSDTNELPDSNLYKLPKLKRGLMSQVSIPFTKNGNVYGVLTIYSDKSYYFRDDLLKIINDMQKDISFALDNIDQRDRYITFFNAIEKSNEWVLITDSNCVIEYVNDVVCHISGYNREEIIGKKPNIFRSGYHDDKFYNELMDDIFNGKVRNSIFVNRNKDGSLFYLESTIIPVTKGGRIYKFVSIGKDITLQVMLSEQLDEIRFRDPVTGVYNINGIRQHADIFFEQFKDKTEGIIGIILLDIYNMGYINSSYGIEFGDKLLKSFAGIIKSFLKNNDIIGRVGNDDFAIVCFNIPDRDSLLSFVFKIFDIFRYPVKVDGNDIKININAGVSVYPQDGDNISDLIERGKMALVKAKKLGENRFEVFDDSFNNLAKNYLYLDQLILDAFDRDNFFLYYQPYYKISTLEIAGVEALVRLKDNDGKMVSPGLFIDYLESSYHLENFERWLLKMAIDFINKYKVRISINLSGRNIKNTILSDGYLNLPTDIGRYLNLEITERAYVRDLEKLTEKIVALKNRTGITISLDDFGTGQSSLYAFKSLPVDFVKIDMSFIRDITISDKSRDFVAAIIEICKIFNFKTIAEGVETKDQLEILKTLGCDYAQGYLLARPMPEETLPFYRG